MQLIEDTIDISRYLGEKKDFVAKVRPGGGYVDDLIAAFAPKSDSRIPDMHSTKLRDVLQFRPAEVTAWAGYSGHRKSMFTGQVALDLCTQRERTLLISPEMQPARTLARMARQCFGVAQPAIQSLRHFAEWTDNRLWIFDHLGRISPETCVGVLRYFANELQGTQVFIDSMMMVCGSEESLDEQKQFATDLVRVAQETGLHVHLIAHCRKPSAGDDTKPPTKYDLRGSAAITDQAHNVVIVWANKAKEAALRKNPNDGDALAQPDAIVSVEKQRNDEFEGRASMWFDRRALRFCDDRLTNCEPYRLEA